MVFKVTFNNISIILWQKQGVSWENHWPAASHWQTLSHHVVSSRPRHDWAGFELTTIIWCHSG